jgi:uncharacterized Tic20 family protein
MVIDPAAPQAVPGGPPPPAVLVRLRSGRDALLSAAEPPDAWRLLDAIYRARPDLRPAAAHAWAPPPPGYGPAPYGYGGGYAGYAGYGPGYAPGHPPGYGGYGYGPGYGPRPVGSSGNETVLAGLAHLGVFLGGWLLPLVIWLASRNTAPYASRQAKQAFFWQMFFFALILVAYVVFFGIFFVSFFSSAASYPTGPGADPNPFLFAPFGSLLIFYALFFVAYLVNIIFSIIGAVQAFQGKPFHYPLLGWV